MNGYVPGQWGNLTATRHDDGRVTVEDDGSEYIGFSTYLLATPGSGVRVDDGHLIVDAEGDWRYQVVAFESEGRVVIGKRIAPRNLHACELPRGTDARAWTCPTCGRGWERASDLTNTVGSPIWRPTSDPACPANPDSPDASATAGE